MRLPRYTEMNVIYPNRDVVVDLHNAFRRIRAKLNKSLARTRLLLNKNKAWKYGTYFERQAYFRRKKKVDQALRYVKAHQIWTKVFDGRLPYPEDDDEIAAMAQFYKRIAPREKVYLPTDFGAKPVEMGRLRPEEWTMLYAETDA